MVAGNLAVITKTSKNPRVGKIFRGYRIYNSNGKNSIIGPFWITDHAAYYAEKIAEKRLKNNEDYIALKKHIYFKLGNKEN